MPTPPEQSTWCFDPQLPSCVSTLFVHENTLVAEVVYDDEFVVAVRTQIEELKNEFKRSLAIGTGDKVVEKSRIFMRQWCEALNHKLTIAFPHLIWEVPNVEQVDALFIYVQCQLEPHSRLMTLPCEAHIRLEFNKKHLDASQTLQHTACDLLNWDWYGKVSGEWIGGMHQGGYGGFSRNLSAGSHGGYWVSCDGWAELCSKDPMNPELHRLMLAAIYQENVKTSVSSDVVIETFFAHVPHTHHTLQAALIDDDRWCLLSRKAVISVPLSSSSSSSLADTDETLFDFTPYLESMWYGNGVERKFTPWTYFSEQKHRGVETVLDVMGKVAYQRSAALNESEYCPTDDIPLSRSGCTVRKAHVPSESQRSFLQATQMQLIPRCKLSKGAAGSDDVVAPVLDALYTLHLMDLEAYTCFLSVPIALASYESSRVYWYKHAVLVFAHDCITVAQVQTK